MIRNALIAVYILVVLAISVVARATVLPAMGSDNDENLTETLQAYNYQTHVGELVATGDGYVLAVNQNNLIPLRSQMDMSAFIGSKVMISGIELEHQLVPKLDIEVVDPLPNFNMGSKDVVFFVFGISEVRQ